MQLGSAQQPHIRFHVAITSEVAKIDSRHRFCSVVDQPPPLRRPTSSSPSTTALQDASCGCFWDRHPSRCAKSPAASSAAQSHLPLEEQHRAWLSFPPLGLTPPRKTRAETKLRRTRRELLFHTLLLQTNTMKVPWSTTPMTAQAALY